MLAGEVHSYFEGKFKSYHVYCSDDKIAVSISPKSFAEEKDIKPLVFSFIQDIKNKYKNITVEVTINHMYFDFESDFDYMVEKIE